MISMTMRQLKHSIEVNHSNLEYFQNNEMATPQNTPSAKKASEFSLKNVDFSKFLDNQDNFDKQKHEKEFCEPLLLGNTKLEIGYTKNFENPRVIVINLDMQ